MIHVISLARTPERMQRFRAANPHIEVEWQPAVDGLDVDPRHRQQYVTRAAPYTPGGVGCLMSHVQFWGEVQRQGRPMTVFEDDAVVHRDFGRLSADVLAALPDGWHICLWGWNFDAAMLVDLLPGVSICAVQADQDRLRDGIERYRHAPIDPRPMRVLRAFGTCGYAISPFGAKVLRALCIPARPTVQLAGGTMQNYGVDVTMNAAYPQIGAYVCVPPLVVTPNDRAASTVQTTA